MERRVGARQDCWRFGPVDQRRIDRDESHLSRVAQRRSVDPSRCDAGVAVLPVGLPGRRLARRFIVSNMGPTNPLARLGLRIDVLQRSLVATAGQVAE